MGNSRDFLNFVRKVGSSILLVIFSMMEYVKWSLFAVSDFFWSRSINIYFFFFQRFGFRPIFGCLWKILALRVFNIFHRAIACYVCLLPHFWGKGSPEANKISPRLLYLSFNTATSRSIQRYFSNSQYFVNFQYLGSCYSSFFLSYHELWFYAARVVLSVLEPEASQSWWFFRNMPFLGLI